MSTLSGVFPNAITPTTAPSADPANQSRLRRDNEAVVFSPVEETEATSNSRRSAIEQPGRLEAEQATNAANPERQSTATNDSDVVDEVREANTDRSASNDRRAEVQTQQTERRAEQEEVKLEKDIELIRELAARDREVRSHEQAHQAVGGQYAGAMEFTFSQGPDGKRYAVGGEVSIDTSKVSGNPEATLRKAEQIRRAALAPAEPSSQDRQVAALATQISLDAQNEIRQVERQELEKAAEERAEQRDLSNEDSEKTEASSTTDKEKTEQVAAESEDRLDDIFEKTSEAIETALDAAYRQQPQQDIGFNLDTTV
jgi:hypothetical protein